MRPVTNRMLKAILLDIEGTTSPISFVTETLFPYSLERLRDFVLAHFEDPDFGAVIEGLFHEYEHEKDTSVPQWLRPEDSEGAIAYLEWLMAKDRKSTGLKAIQGLIWKGGFEGGDLKGEFFSDVPTALERWTAEGKDVYIFSSGSVLAQKQLFGFSQFGDLSRFLSGYFDTETGPKQEAASYGAIAASIGFAANEILFLSDIPEELAAARDAGMDVRLSIRPGNKPVDSIEFLRAENFNFI
jgi:enolase-phosphatase E1